ncbi:MAG TPA: beta-ketoacyl-[acyl-carrier-protein] synthase family protein [Vicinamibacterales bacterium]|nr:beta-ketoacyl-[acyl-carrier-protein] synthase family protein [Vicinamibacterales bacterium]
MTRRRVVITGIGLVTSVGGTREETWTSLVNGVCGIGPVTLFDTEGYRSRMGAQVPYERIAHRLTPLQRRRWSRGDRIGMLAAIEAVDDSGLAVPDDPSRVGVVLGAGTADLLRNERYLEVMVTRGIEHARPSDAWNHFSSTPVDIIASQFGFEGYRTCIVAACASSTMAIGCAADAIRDGRLDAAVTGGTDTLARLTFSGFNALRVMDPGECRPFDRARAGMNIGEGASMLVLEDYERARARGAHVYAEVAGHSLTCEAFHPTSPEPDGRAIAATIDRALADARVAAGEIDHVNAHGTATPHNDRAEARGIRLVFGAVGRRLPVTSVKSMIGHCLGAAGGLEAAITALTIARGVIPPTIHHAETDPDCDVEIVANEARETHVRCAVSTSLAFGGNDAAVVLRAV